MHTAGTGLSAVPFYTYPDNMNDQHEVNRLAETALDEMFYQLTGNSSESRAGSGNSSGILGEISLPLVCWSRSC